MSGKLKLATILLLISVGLNAAAATNDCGYYNPNNWYKFKILDSELAPITLWAYRFSKPYKPGKLTQTQMLLLNGKVGRIPCGSKIAGRITNMGHRAAAHGVQLLMIDWDYWGNGHNTVAKGGLYVANTVDRLVREGYMRPRMAVMGVSGGGLALSGWLDFGQDRQADRVARAVFVSSPVNGIDRNNVTSTVLKKLMEDYDMKEIESLNASRTASNRWTSWLQPLRGSNNLKIYTASFDYTWCKDQLRCSLGSLTEMATKWYADARADQSLTVGRLVNADILHVYPTSDHDLLYNDSWYETFIETIIPENNYAY
jgi:hypothetical protein